MEILDKFVTYLVCWYNTLHQVLQSRERTDAVLMIGL